MTAAQELVGKDSLELIEQDTLSVANGSMETWVQVDLRVIAARIDALRASSSPEVVAYIEEYTFQDSHSERHCRGLVWADHPHNTPGHTFTPLTYAKQPDQQAEPGRDREADRTRLPDVGFNRWLDNSVSDFGHIVWHTITNISDAWHGWDAREYYEDPEHFTRRCWLVGDVYREPAVKESLTTEAAVVSDAMAHLHGIVAFAMSQGMQAPYDCLAVVEAALTALGVVMHYCDDGSFARAELAASSAAQVEGRKMKDSLESIEAVSCSTNGYTSP